MFVQKRDSRLTQNQLKTMWDEAVPDGELNVADIQGCSNAVALEAASTLANDVEDINIVRRMGPGSVNLLNATSMMDRGVV